MSPRHIAWILALSTAICRTSHADKSGAVLAFDEAVRLMDAGQIAEACPKFAESYRLEAQLGALMHLADCQEQAGQLASAWASFRDAGDLAEKENDSRAADARGYAAALEQRVSRLTIAVSVGARTEQLTIRRDGEVVGKPLWGSAVPVDPGEHRLDVTAPGRKPWSTTITVAATAEQATLEIPPLEANPSPTTAPRAPAFADEPPRRHGDAAATQRLVGWTVAGGGVIGLGVGLLFTLKTSSTLGNRDEICPTRSDCEPSEIAHRESLTEDAQSSNLVSIVGFAAGGVLLAGGLVTVFAAPTGEEVSFAPALGPDLAGLRASGTW